MILLIIPMFLLSQKVTVKQLFNVRTIKVKEMNTSAKRVNYGYVEADESRVVDIDAWFSGYVTELFVDSKYQKVKKYQLLAKIYSPKVYKAKQDYLYALNFNDKRNSKSMVQGSKKNLVLLGVSKKEIRNIYTKRKVDTYTSIFSPIDGWVFIKNINRGSSFKTGSKLFEIVNLDRVWIESKIYQNQISSISEMKKFEIEIKGLNKKFSVKKSIVYPKMDKDETTLTLRLLVDNRDDLLKVGMFAKIKSWNENKKVMVIPHSSAIHKNGKWFVFLATQFKGVYEPLEIEIKPLDENYFIVTKGLTLDDKIVDNALFMMDADAQMNGIY